MLSAGIRQSSRITSAVWLAPTPIFSATFPCFRPGFPFSPANPRPEEARRDPRAAPVQPLVHDAVREGRRAPAPAVLLREERGVELDVMRLLDDVPGDHALLVVLQGDRAHLPLRELVRGLLH